MIRDMKKPTQEPTKKAEKREVTPWDLEDWGKQHLREAERLGGVLRILYLHCGPSPATMFSLAVRAAHAARAAIRLLQAAEALRGRGRFKLWQQTSWRQVAGLTKPTPAAMTYREWRDLPNSTVREYRTNRKQSHFDGDFGPKPWMTI